MTTDARSRLAAQAAAAGYPPSLLALIAHATLPHYQLGTQLDDPQIEQVTDAVEVLTQAGYQPDTLPEQLAGYQRRHGEHWRERFWARALQIASVRYSHPELYGLSHARQTPSGSPSTPHCRGRHRPPDPRFTATEGRPR